MTTLLAVSGPNAGMRFELVEDLIVGRSPSCQVVLADDSQVSRRHARFVCRDAQCLVEDLGSRNGTLLNGERVVGEMALAPGDRIQIGGTALVFEAVARIALRASPEQAEASGPTEEFLPATGGARAVLQAAVALSSCASEDAALRRAAEQARELLAADVGASQLAGELGLATAAVAGAERVDIPAGLARAAFDRRQAARIGGRAAAPLWAGGEPFGLVYAERADDPFTDADLGILAALGRLSGEAVAAARSRQPPPSGASLLGTSRTFRKVLEQVRRAAAFPGVVAFYGPAGSGKAALAQLLHSRSSRALAPLVCVDCRGRASEVDEELFGRPGRAGAPPQLSALRRADGGTLVLAGLDYLPRELGLRLARALGQRLAPLAEGGEAPTDVRVITTSRESPEQLAAQRRLEPELASMLDGQSIAVPPLSERKGDLPLQFDHFAVAAARVWGSRALRLSDEARQLLLDYSWPGNLRELRSCAGRLALLCPGEEVLPGHLPPEIVSGGLPQGGTLADQVSRLERDSIAHALRQAKGKKIRAAELLGISRPTLDKKIALYRLSVK